MTVTLHWWALPILIFCAGSIWAGAISKPGGGWDIDLMPPLIVIASFVAAIAMVMGHFL